MFYFYRKIYFIFFVALAPIGFAQNYFKGKVLSALDSTSVSFAIISLQNYKLNTQCNERAEFEFKNITQKNIEIEIKKIGFISSKFSVELLENDTSTKVFYLKEDINNLDEIVVYGSESSLKSETANNIEVLETQAMRQQGAMNLSDGIAKLPGVNQLSTGAGISKPVIRGLYGNRIQIVLLGMRFDNQQWQDEHGLGLSDIGVDRIEIIKGPTALFYGSEAMGGVVNIINEKPAPQGKIQAEVSSKYFSNTNGYVVDAGVKKSHKNSYFGLHVGNESHADYSDGNNKRILNSRFGAQIVKATYGYKYKNWKTENNYLFAINNFGFLMDAYQLYDKADSRWARSFERPHHTVVMNMFTSQNTFKLKASELKINLGTHFNNRQEQEGASGISLNMYLNSYAFAAMWEKKLTSKTDITFGSQNQFQTNLNAGSRIIVPDAQLAEASLYSFFKTKQKWIVVEGGLRYDFKNIITLKTGILNNGNKGNPGKNILDVNRNYNTVNGSLGASLFDMKHVNMKLNFCSGYRAPNLAELSSNGLHEGSVRYEVGNTNLKVEQNFCGDLFLEYYQNNFSIFGNGYSNQFLNYIYLQGSTQDYLGFTIYNYVQQNATISGLEGGIKIHPIKIKWLHMSSVYSGIVGQTDKKQNLPFIPAQKINSELKFKLTKMKKLKNNFVTANYIYVLPQNNFNQFETATIGYYLVNASAGTEILYNKFTVSFSASCNNILNNAYYDHLSRFKYFGIYNMGRSLNFNFKIQFN